MGTNFYMRKPLPTKDEFVGKVREIVEKSEKEYTYDVKEYIDSISEETHICKRSGGWRILFDHNNGKLYPLTRNGLDTYIKANGLEVVDEYGEVMTPDEFWNMVDEWENTSNTKLHTCETYFKEYPKDYVYVVDRSKAAEIESKCGIKLPAKCYGDFINDGLRWSVSSDFS